MFSYESEFSLEELGPQSNGSCCGKSVDEEFVKFMEDICGKSVIDKFRIDHIDDYIGYFNRDFEVRKRSKSVQDSKINLPIPFTLLQLMKSKNRSSSLSDSIKLSKYATNQVMFNAKNQKLTITAEVFSELFEPSIQSLIEDVKAICRQDNVGVIMMTGGFANSEEVQNALKKEFSTAHRIVLPSDSELSVLKGAVLYGHNAQHSIGTTFNSNMYPIFLMRRFVLMKSRMHTEQINEQT